MIFKVQFGALNRTGLTCRYASSDTSKTYFNYHKSKRM